MSYMNILSAIMGGGSNKGSSPTQITMKKDSFLDRMRKEEDEEEDRKWKEFLENLRKNYND